MVYPGRLQRVGDVRYHRHDLAGVSLFRLRFEERMDSLALADVQPNFSDDLFERLAAAVERADRGRVDQFPLRHGARG